MKFMVVSEMVDNDGKLLAYLLIGDDGSLATVTTDILVKTMELHKDIEFSNAVYDEQYKVLQGVGEQLSNYPKVNKDYAVIGKNGLTIFATVLQDDKPVGVVSYNALGTRFILSYEKFIALTKRFKETNYTLQVVDGRSIPVPKAGITWGTVIAKDSKKKKRSYNSGLGEQAIEVDEVQVDNSARSKLSVISPSMVDEISSNDVTASAQKKMLLAKVNIAKLAPYYSCIYDSLEKRAKPGLGTLGVTEDTMYYDLEFPASLTTAELSFVLLHEVCHVVMQHSLRRGDRDPELWNIATDLYINSILCRDFGIEFKGGVRSFQEGEIKTPEFGVYLESIGETLDFAKDSPESIYTRLSKDSMDMQMPPQGEGSGGGKGDSSSSDGTSKNKKQSGESGGDQKQSSDSSSSKSGDSQEGGGSGSENPFENQKQDSKEKKDSGDSGKEGESTDNDPKNGSGGADEKAQMKQVSVTYNGKKLTGRIMTDLHTKDNSDTKDGKKANMDASKNALQKAKTKIKMTEEKIGSKLDRTTGIGQGGSLIERYIEFGLSEGVDWRQLIRNIATEKPKKMYTLAMPNQDYMSMNMTVAERRRIGKPTEAAKFVVAIDVSGSVSEEDLNYFLSEVNTLTKFYKVNAELIYWSTDVGDAGSFSTMKDLLKVHPVSTGGTDVSCVFRYLSGKEKTSTGKVEPLRVKDIKGVFIITDGFFNKNYAEYETYFGTKTVWLIDGNPVNFEAMFGRVLALEKKKDE